MVRQAQSRGRADCRRNRQSRLSTTIHGPGPPRIITAIINGTAPAGLTATPDGWGRRVVDTLDNDVGCPRQSTHLSGPRDTPNSSIAGLLKSPAKRLHRQSTVTPQWSGIAAPLVRSRNDRAARK